MAINKWRLIEPAGNEDPGSAQCMMCKEYLYEQYDMKFCSFCGTQREGQLDCSEKGRKWEDVARKHGRSIYDNKRYDKAYWSVQWRLEDLTREQWAKERCFNRRDAVVKYKDRIQRQGESVHFWEVRLVRVAEDLFIKQVLISGGIGGKKMRTNLRHLLFVYGSLKRSGQFHHLIQEEIELLNSDCYTRGILISLGKYPALIDGNGMVCGELFEITDEGLRICDEVEGYSSLKEVNKSLYYREKRDVFDSGESLIGSAIVYIFNLAEISFEWKNKTAKIQIDTN